jgi:hypothetical protein
VAILHEGRLALSEELEAAKAQWNRPLEEIFTAVTSGALVPGPSSEVRS